MSNESNKLALLNPNEGAEFPLETSSPLGKGGQRGLEVPLNKGGEGVVDTVIPAQAGIQSRSVIPAEAGIQSNINIEAPSKESEDLRNTILSSDTAFRLLKDIEANPEVTQRHLAQQFIKRTTEAG